MSPDDLAPLPDAPAPEPAATPPPAEPPKRIDVVREAYDRQKDKAAPETPEKRETPPKAAPGPAQGQPRAPDGRFIPTTDHPAPDRTPSPMSAADRAASAVADASDAQLDATAPAPDRPPSSWSPAAKVAFDNLPDIVKAEIGKRETEIRAGFQKLQEYKPVDKYLEMAKRSGTTLDRALEAYVGFENLIRRDPIVGIEEVLKNAGIDPRAFMTAYQTRLASGYRTPGEPTPSANRTANDPSDIVRLAKEAARAEFEERAYGSEVAAFRADPKNRFFDNVQARMVELVNAGMAHSVKDAYDMACRLDPEISRLLNQPPAADPRRVAAVQARSAARSIVGAPSAGATVNGQAGPSKDASRRQVIQGLYEAQKGGGAGRA